MMRRNGLLVKAVEEYRRLHIEKLVSDKVDPLGWGELELNKKECAGQCHDDKADPWC